MFGSLASDMLLAPQSDPSAPQHPAVRGAAAPVDPATVREQLRRVLADPLFANSKRYPVLLAYVVEQTLAGNGAELKERTIGVEAFGRQPAYNVALDPVVRMTAAEVRKRLVQYYYRPEHMGELVLELPLGTYIPSFHPSEVSGVEPAQAVQTHLPLPRALTARIRWWAVAAMLATLAAGFGAGVLWNARPGLLARQGMNHHSGLELPGAQGNMERFWAPVTSATSTVTYCLGQPTESLDRRDPEQTAMAGGSLNVSDVITLARSIAPIVARNGAFRVVGSSAANYGQLREGPLVLIGAFDNAWSLRIVDQLPYGFSDSGGLRRIFDRKNPVENQWTLQWQRPETQLAVDYAVVARIHDHVTGQPVILLAGILAEGTEAAGEVVSNPAYLDALLARAPADWDKRNLEAVIETHVIDGHPGPPSVVAFQSW